jgi:hypothetical protein
MKCVSCETEINPKWRHAINQNICPFCGQSIMEELLKSLLSTLQDAMEKLQAYPDQLNDWLLSNYNFIKTDSPNLKTYLPKEVLKDMKKEYDGEEFEKKRTTIKVKTDQGEEEVVTEKIQSDSKTASFFERAEVTKRIGNDDNEGEGGGNMGSRDGVDMQKVKAQKPPTFKTAAEKTEYIKGLKKKIEKHGSQVAIDETGLAAMISPEMLENADSESVAEYGSMISSGDIVASGLPVSSGGLDDEDAMANRILSMNLSVAQNNSKGSDGGYNAKDAAALQKLVDKAQGGGSGGSFSRRG